MTTPMIVVSVRGRPGWLPPYVLLRGI